MIRGLNMSNIDFVLAWVDGSDPQWIQDKKLYQSNKSDENDDCRYRDWDNLRYWFRGVEKFTPWVNKVFFVTYGHIPLWLNQSCEKLVIIKHEEYIPKKYLPTFSSHTIELNLHRIKELSERFVYFNDDMFIIKSMKKADFFVNGLPCDEAALTYITSTESDLFPHILLNNIAVINKNFNKKEVINKHKNMWFNHKYSKSTLIRTFLLNQFDNFTGIKWQHLPSAYLKSTFEKVWVQEYEILDKTCSHKFREITDINQYVFKYWQLASNNFYPDNIERKGKLFNLPYQSEELFETIKDQKKCMVCANDTENCNNFDLLKEQLAISFDSILSEKSIFEL